MVLMIQSVLGCILFTMVLIPAAKNPMKYLSMYPEAVQKRVLKLPQYLHLLTAKNNRIRMTIMQSTVFAATGILLCLLAKVNNFYSAFIHMYLLFLILSTYDLLVIDWLLFCRVKRFRIPGIEDMDKEYKDYFYHFKVFLRGILLLL